MMYTNMKKTELVDLCKTNGLKTNGNVQTLIERLQAFDQKKVEDANAGIGVGANAKKSYAINAMRPAIIAANASGNRRAITADDAAEADVDSERFEQWKSWVSSLWDITCDYVTVKRNRKSTEEERSVARGKIYPAWRSMLKVGEENVLSPKMYLREDDVESLVGFCEDFVGTAHGTEQVCVTENKFRKLVETLIGCRIKGCETLPAADRDIILKYEGALKRKQRAEEALNGVPKKSTGIIADLKKIKVEVAKLEEKLVNLGLTKEAIAEAIAPLNARKKELQEAKKRSEKSLKEAKEDIEANAEKAKVIYDRIDAVANA